MKWEMEVEEKEIEAVLEKICDLHDKLSDAIHSICRSHFLTSLKSRGDGFCSRRRSRKVSATDSDHAPPKTKEFRAVDDEDVVREAKSLNAIRTALESLEDQLEFFHIMQTQQRVERDVALASLEQSRILLAMRLAEHRGKRYKFIEEAQALVEDVWDTNRFVSPKSLFNAPRVPHEDFVAPERKRSNVFFNIVFSSFNFVKQSLRLDHVGGVLGNAAMVAISMLALMHLQQTSCRGKYNLDLPQRHEDVIYKRNLNRVSQPNGSPNDHLSELDVLSARG